MRKLRVAITLTLSVGMLVPALRVTAAPGIPCASLVELPGVGTTCRRPGGLFELISSRTGKSLGLTHGPDRSQGALASPTTTSTGTGTRPVVCADPSDYHVEVIYARAFDDADQYATRAPTMRTTLERANYYLNKDAVSVGASRADYKVLCTAGVVRVHNVVLPTTKSSDSFNTVLEDVADLGFVNARTKYLIHYDDQFPCGCGGLAQAPADDRLASDNRALRGPMYAVTLALSPSVLMHELSHTMGAVQVSAPHSTGGGHCYDGHDIMCYSDGAPKGSLYNTKSCAPGFIFDCNKDDYFNPNPAPGNYLATHWNLGSRLNRYIKFAEAPDTSRPVISITEPRAGYLYINGCSSRGTVTGSGRPVFRGLGCLYATATDADTGVDRLDIYFDGKLVSTQRQMPTATLSFELGRGPGVEIPLTLVATDFAVIPSGPNVTTTTILVDVL